VVLVRALPNELRNVEKYLKATQLMAERQVMLEAKIIDVTLSEDFQAGVNWGALQERAQQLDRRIGVAQPGSTLTIGSQAPRQDYRAGQLPGAASFRRFP
jgi:MSHA biogenesis protein MshL